MRAAPFTRRNNKPDGRNDSAADLCMIRLQELQQDTGSAHRSDPCRNPVFSNRFIGFAEFPRRNSSFEERRSGSAATDQEFQRALRHSRD